MYEKIKSVVNQMFSSVIQPNFNPGIFINDLEQKLFSKYFIRNKEYNNYNEVKNILIVRLDGIGDYILTTGFIREISKNFPNAKITLVVSPSVYDLAKTNKYVNEIYVFEGSSNNRLVQFTFVELLQFCLENLWFKDGELRQFDYAFSPQCGSDVFIALLLIYLSGAVERIGFGSRPYTALLMDLNTITPEEKEELIPNYWLDSFVLTNPIIITKNEDHEVDKYNYIIKVLGLKIFNTDLELTVLDEDIQKVQKYLIKNKEKIVVGIGSSQEVAKYDIKLLNKALQLIGEDKKYIFIGGVNDIEQMQYVTIPHINLVGQLSLREIAALISQCNLYIGNDTGLMHIAAVFKVPIIELSREAKEKTYSLPHVYSSIYRFHPWQCKYIVLQPDFALDQCKEAIRYGGCNADKAHCINQITPEEITEAYIKINQ